MLDLNWLNTLNKPALMPPPIAFGIVWPILYVMIFLSLYFYLKDGFSKSHSVGVFFFFLQLVLNFAWTPVFFGLHKIGYSLVIIFALLVFVAITILLFFKKSKIAGWLLVPYWLWLCFATYLNYEIIRLN